MATQSQKVMCVCVCVCVCVFYVLYLFPLRWGSTQGLISEYLLAKPMLQIEYPSYHLTSYRISVLIQKPSAQTPKSLLIMEKNDMEKKKLIMENSKRKESTVHNLP